MKPVEASPWKLGDLIWVLIIAALVAFVAHPEGQIRFSETTKAHPYLMGFFKFALLASMGELLAGRLVNKSWKRPKAFLGKIILWGLYGMAITLYFAIFVGGIKSAVAAGQLPGGGLEGFPHKLAIAFFASLTMNLTFGYALMACHRFTDTVLDIWSDAGRISGQDALNAVNWGAFLSFVTKTLLFFWVPAHTLVFLMPWEEFRILAAAFLSIALGILLALAKLKALRQQQAC